MDKSFLTVFILIIVIAIGAYFLAKSDPQAPNTPGVPNNAPGGSGNAPQIAGTTPEGKQIDVGRDFQGKVVLVDFWASWCKPCRDFIPTLKSLNDKYKSAGLEIVGVYIDQRDKNYANLNAIKKNMGANWTQIVGQGAMLSSQRYGVRSIPHLTLIDKNGNLIQKRVNNRNDIERLIVQALQK